MIELNVTYFSEKLLLKWRNKFSCLENPSVLKWITDKAELYTRSGKNLAGFKPTPLLNDLQKFLDFCKTTVDEVLSSDLDTRNNLLRKYLSMLLTQGNNHVSVKNAIQAHIKSFFSNRSKDITYQLKCESTGIKKDYMLLNKEKIQTLSNKLNEKYKLILKLQAQTGLRISDILEQLPNFSLKKYKDHYYIAHFKTRKEDVVINYIFLTNELTQLITAITQRQNLDGFSFKEILQTAEGNTIDRVNYLHKLKDINFFKEEIKTHSFRIWFRSQVTRSGVDLEFQEHLMGHTLSNLANAYNQNLQDIDWYYDQWCIIEPYLMIEGNIVDKTDEEVAKLREELIKEKTRNEMVASNLAKENLELKDELNKIKESMQKFEELAKMFLLDKKIVKDQPLYFK